MRGTWRLASDTSSAYKLAMKAAGGGMVAALGTSPLSLRSTRVAAYPLFVTEPPVLFDQAFMPHDEYEFEDISRLQDFNAFLMGTLGLLKPAFLDQFRGSMLRSEDRGPDWLTQASASLRKLLLGVLHTVAPDNLVLPWVTNLKKQLDQNGHPTRRTKIAWLCNSIPNEGYRKFVKADLESALPLIDVFDSAVHVNEFQDFEESFSWAHLRLKVALYRIVKIWQSRQNYN